MQRLEEYTLAGRLRYLLSQHRKNYQSELKHYMNFHSNSLNWRIHGVTVPIEWISWVAILSLINCHWLFSLLAVFCNITVGSFPSSLTAVFQIFCALLVSKTKEFFSTMNLIAIAICMQVVAWIVQVYIGHFLIEKNNPAMMSKITVSSVFFSLQLSWDYSAQFDEELD
jgi:uncharacterized membrane protein YGL010W